MNHGACFLVLRMVLRISSNPPFPFCATPKPHQTIFRRSARLVLMGGTVIVLSYLSPINESILIIWGPEHALEWLWPSLLLFGIAPVLFGSYICRALRLAVVFHPRAKRALPWLIPVRTLAVVVLFGFLCIHPSAPHTFRCVRKNDVCVVS